MSYTKLILLCNAMQVFLVLPSQVEAGRVIWPCSGSVTSPYGQRATDFHTGIDIGVGSNTILGSPGHGTVTSYAWQSCGGNVYNVGYGNGWDTRFAHTNSAIVGVGTPVQRNQNVARSGSTGSCTTGPHLHFEVRRDGVAQYIPGVVGNYVTRATEVPINYPGLNDTPPPPSLLPAPDSVSWGNGRIDVVKRGPNDNVYHRSWNNGTWSAWSNLGALCNGSPTICSMYPGRLDVFMRGFDNNLWRNAYDGGQWWGWQNLGDYLSSSPDAVSRGTGKIDVVFRGSNDDVWHRWMDNWAWVGYRNLGMDANSDPTICAMPSGRLDIFFRGFNNTLWHNAGLGNNTWWGWEDLGDYLTAGVDAVSRGEGKIDVVFRGNSDDVWHRWMDGFSWVGYRNLGLEANSDPSICRMPSGRLDIWTTGYDNNLWHNAGPGNNTWWGWENLGRP